MDSVFTIPEYIPDYTRFASETTNRLYLNRDSGASGKHERHSQLGKKVKD